MIKRIAIVLPLILFIVMVIILWRGLQRDPHLLPSPLINRSMPHFILPSLKQTGQPITGHAFQGHVTLLNVFASWCLTCRVEHAVLMDIAQSRKVIMLGLNYKDNNNKARAWLHQYGNPYRKVIVDRQGTLAINLGVYGTPETYIVDKSGIIRYKHTGAINPSVWRNELLPEIKRWQ